MTHTERSESELAGSRFVGSRGPRCSGFWTGRLRREGSRDELACPARGQTDFAQAPVCQPTALSSFCAEGWQSGALRLGRGGRGVLTSGRPGSAPGRDSRVEGQAVRPSAEPGWPEVRLTWGPAYDQAAAEASELASVSVARTGDALAGVLACLAGFHEAERSGALGRLRAVRRDSAAAFVPFGGAVGVAHGRGADR